MAKFLYWLIPEQAWAEQKGRRNIAEDLVGEGRAVALLFGYQVSLQLKQLDANVGYRLVQFDHDAVSPAIEYRQTDLGIQPFAHRKLPAHAMATAEPLVHKMGIWLLPESFRRGQHQEVTRIYLVRHGETDWERQNRFEGRLDSPLTEHAEMNAKRRCAQLREVPFVAAISSSAGRALSTRNLLLGDRSVPRLTHAGVIDMHLGELEGMSEANARQLYPEALHDLAVNPDSFVAPNGESFEDVQYRAVNAINQLARQYQGGSILVVSHAAVIATVACHFEKTTLSHFWKYGEVASLSGLVATYRGRDGWVEDLWHHASAQTPAQQA